jgi:hypothetical protein
MAIAVDPQPLPSRPSPAMLRWVVALLLLVAGSSGLVPVVETDEAARVPRVALAERQQWARARRRRQPRPTLPQPHRRPQVLRALRARVHPLLTIPAVRRGPPRTPCVVALT